MFVHQNIPHGVGELRPKLLRPARRKLGMGVRDLAVWFLPVVPNQARAPARTLAQAWSFNPQMGPWLEDHS